MSASFRLSPAPLDLPSPPAKAAEPKAANADVLQDSPRWLHVGRYQLLDSSTADVHSRTYDAWDPLLDRGVTVRTLQFGLKMSARIAVDRQLLRAARAAAKLNHRFIATVLDSGLSAHGVYIATERLIGQDLERAAYEGWRPSTPEVLKLVRRAAGAIAYAHQQGVVHGGLEPSSIFVTTLGRPKLLNFGLAQALRDPDVAELAQMHLGSLCYRSPEQLVGNPAQPRSDVFSLGVILYELLAGRRAFTEDTPDELLRAVLEGPEAPLSTLRPDLPEALLRLVASAMAFEPEARPASVADMAAALRRLERWGSATPAVAPTSTSMSPAVAPSHRWQRPLGFVRKLLGLGVSSEPVRVDGASPPAPMARKPAPATQASTAGVSLASRISAVEASSA